MTCMYDKNHFKIRQSGHLLSDSHKQMGYNNSNGKKQHTDPSKEWINRWSGCKMIKVSQFFKDTLF